MLADQPTQLSLPQLFDALPDSVLFFRAVRDVTDQQIVDFVIDYANPAVHKNAHNRYQTTIGSSVRHDNRHDSVTTERLFVQLKAVTETGQSNESEYYNQTLNEWVSVTRAKVGEGVLNITRIITASKQAALENEFQRRLLDGILNTALNTTFVYEAIRDETGQIQDFRVLLVNERGRRDVVARLGVDPAGKTLLSINPNSRQSGQFNLFCQVIESGEPVQVEQFYPNAQQVWYNTAITKLNDGVVVMGIDITGQKKNALEAERQAGETNRQAELLNSVLNSSINGIMSFEAIRDAAGTISDFRILTMNEAAAQMVFKTVEEVVGNRMMTVFPGNVETGLFALYADTTNTGQPTRTEVNYNQDGLDYWLDISTQKLGDGFVVTFTDVSVVKRAAQLVEQSAAELQTVIDTSQTGIFLFSPVRDRTGDVVDFRFRLANRMLASYVGQEPEAIIGALGSHWFPDYQTNGLFEAYRKTYLTGETQRFDIHYDGNGIDVWLDIMSTKMGDEVLVTFGDYTPLKKLQQELESSVVDLQRSNANLEQFAYVASHDLQEPLRKIQAFGDIIETKYGAVIDEQGIDMIRRMQSAAARMQVLIKDVLTYSRITTKRDAIKSVDLGELVADVVDDLETAITDWDATVTIDPLPTVTGDPGQLRQLFQNLLSNALKFTKPRPVPGGTNGPEQRNALITITTRPTRGRDAGIVVSPGDADRLFHLIEIADNGIGFEPHQAERIFQVFQRLHNRSTYQGTGIGLAIVKKVAENHNGHIQAVGRPGEGATFRILLPV